MIVAVWCGDRERRLLEVRKGLSDVAFTLRSARKKDTRASSDVKNIADSRNHKCKGPEAGINWALKEQLERQQKSSYRQLRLGEAGGVLAAKRTDPLVLQDDTMQAVVINL